MTPEPTKPQRKARRPLHLIAAEIQADLSWSPIARYHARPYLEAMHQLNSIEDKYYLDSAKSIVRYFLANASTWRGETARRIKLELKGMLL